MKEQQKQKVMKYLHELCIRIGERPVGSRGNLEATDFFSKTISSFGWEVSRNRLNAMDWEEEGATVNCGDDFFDALVSPYSVSCDVERELVPVSSVAELDSSNIGNKIVLLHGAIASEQLMPQNFVFFNPEEHRRIIALLEEKVPAAIICATGRNSVLAGGLYPFPLIEDGDFMLPSVYMTEEEGGRLLPCSGKAVRVKSLSYRIPSTAYNIVSVKGRNRLNKIVITAHIDSKKGSPGAIDNATGVITLLLAAEMLSNYNGEKTIEIVALNGEDYYGIPGQMDYISRNKQDFSDVFMNINIDGAGYKDGGSLLSFYGVSENIYREVTAILKDCNEISEGPQWPQSDHSIFVQYGRPAMAVTSAWFSNNMETQSITHTPKDNPGIVDCSKIVDIADALVKIILRLILIC